MEKNLVAGFLRCLQEFLAKQSYFKCEDVEGIRSISAEDVSVAENTFLSDLQMFVEGLQKLQQELQTSLEKGKLRSGKKRGPPDPEGRDRKETNEDVAKLPKRRKLFKMEFPKDRVPALDPSLVQVRASNLEVERRINAFIERKKLEVDEGNKREFCNRISDPENSCARTDAVFVPHGSSKSHVKVTRIHNLYGPQTLSSESQSTAPNPPRVLSIPDRKPVLDIPEGVEERLRNIETHVGIKQGIPKDVFERLRILENRVLFLESLSPEYFDHGSVPKVGQPKVDIKREFPVDKKELSLNDINARLKALKEQLKAPIKSEPA